MSKLSDFLYYDLYPTLFACLPMALPEFGFKRTTKGYQSTTTLKITGEQGEKGKVYVYENNISRLIDYTRNSISIFDYIQQRDHLSNADTLTYLAKLAGTPLPRLSDDYHLQAESYLKIRQQSQIWEDAHQYFIYLLNEAPYAGQHRDDLRQYLSKERNYSGAEIQAMQIGFIPSFEKLFVYLTQTKQYSPDEVTQHIKLNTQIGHTHCLAIPYRDAIGQIRGIIARSIQALPPSVPKYLYSTGLKKDDTLFNLKAAYKNQAHIVIVEGLLDALHAETKGIDNVVALGGTSLNIKHIHQLIKYNPKGLILCLDNDAAGQKAVQRALQNIAESSSLKAYIAQLPAKSAKDPDQFLRLFGTDAFKQVLQNAIPAYKFRFQQLIEKYLPANNNENTDNQNNPSNTILLNNLSNTDNISLLEKTSNIHNSNKPDNTTDNSNTVPVPETFPDRVGEGASAIAQDEFLQAVHQLAISLKDPLDRDRLLADCFRITQLWGITRESLDNTIKILRENKNNEENNAAFTHLLRQAQYLKTQGNTEQALHLLQEQSRRLLLQNKASAFEHLTTTITESFLIERLSHKPQNLLTGYVIAGEEITLPAAALSILCAPTAHGKTTFLLNMLLNLVQNYPNKQIHLFSYEEDSDTLFINALNIFINKELAKNNRKAIKAYFADNSAQLFEKATSLQSFQTAKQHFFAELIASGRLHIHYVDYDSDTLIDAIHYLRQNTPTAAVLIDYMQLLHKKTNRRFNSRQEELKEICLNMKDMVIETGLPVVLAAQFNREVINPALLHPTKIGEAGDIERIAHMILGIWNNNFDPIGNDAQLSELKNSGFVQPNTIYVKLLKNRGGLSNLADLLAYNGNTGKIDKINKRLL